MEQQDPLARRPTRTIEEDRIERRNAVALCAGLVIAVIFIYAPTSRHGFVNWDDPLYVTQNPHVRRGLSWEGFRWSFTQPHAANWHPLTWLSHMLDCELFGVESEDAGGHHLVSVALHAAVSVLLFVVLRRMTGALWPSALVAALFAVHPLRVESVAWISERKDVLSGFFFMLTLLAYQWYAQRPKPWRYAAVLLSLTFGLMAKPMLVTVPFVLLLLDFWPLGRLKQGAWVEEVIGDQSSVIGKDVKSDGISNSVGDSEATAAPKNPQSAIRNPQFIRLLLEKVPLLVLSAACCLITVATQQAAGVVASAESVPWAWRLVTAPVAYLVYLGKTIWPTNLAFFYPHPAVIASEEFKTWVIAAGAATMFLAVVTLAAVVTARRIPYLLVGWLWFLGTLVPVIGLMQVGNQSWADRYAYLPLIGVYLILAWGLRDLTSWLASTRGVSGTACGVVCLALVGLAISARRQVAVWRDNQALYAHALAVTSNNYVAHNNLGDALQQLGRFDEAVTHYPEALRIKPDYAEAHYNWGLALEGQQRLDDAMEHYQAALRLEPDFAEAYNSLGLVFYKQGRISDAMANYQQALRLKPDYAGAHNNLGNALRDQGSIAEAMAQYRLAIQIAPDDALAHNNMGGALGRLGRTEEAVAHFEEAVRLQPGIAEVHNNLAFALRKLGRFDGAVAHYQEALRLTPDFVKALHDLAWLLATCPEAPIRDGPQAVKLAERSASLTDYKVASVLDTLSAAYAEVGDFDEAVRWQQKAVELTPEQQQDARRQRLELYISGTPYRDAAIQPASWQ